MKIEDPLLHPLYIEVDGDNHTLYESKTTGNGNTREELIGYFSSLSGALAAAVRIKANKGQTTDIERYITKYEVILEQFKQQFKE